MARTSILAIFDCGPATLRSMHADTRLGPSSRHMLAWCKHKSTMAPSAGCTKEGRKEYLTMGGHAGKARNPPGLSVALELLNVVASTRPLVGPISMPKPRLAWPGGPAKCLVGAWSGWGWRWVCLGSGLQRVGSYLLVLTWLSGAPVGFRKVVPMSLDDRP